MLVHELIRKKTKEGDVGLELEVEAEIALPMTELPKPWSVKAEGSLRGDPGCAVEYYTQGPIKCDQWKLQKIRRLTDLLLKPEQKTRLDCNRTSFHVHVNALEYTPKQVWTAITTYWLLENMLMHFCGEHRQGNMFCLRLKDAEAVLKYAADDIANTTPFKSLAGDIIRYSGINLNALPKFGTLEFRGMRGAVDPVLLDNWSTGVHFLVTEAIKNFKSPEDVLDNYLDNKLLYIADKVIHPSIRVDVYKNINNDEVLDNALMLGNFVYDIDWDRWEENIEEEWKKKKKDKLYIDDTIIVQRFADNFVNEIEPENNFNAAINARRARAQMLRQNPIRWAAEQDGNAND